MVCKDTDLIIVLPTFAYAQGDKLISEICFQPLLKPF